VATALIAGFSVLISFFLLFHVKTQFLSLFFLIEFHYYFSSDLPKEYHFLKKKNKK